MPKLEIRNYLDAVQAVYAAHVAAAPQALTLTQGAAARELKQVAKALGSPLHAELAALWRATNGSAGVALFQDGTHLSSYALLSIEEALESRASFQRRAPRYTNGHQSELPRDPRVGTGWFSPGWLPFASIEGGSLQLLVDHAPLGSGAPGQIIGFVHDPDQVLFVADSLGQLLELSLTAIQADPLEFLGIY